MEKHNKTAVLIDDESSALEILSLKLSQLFPDIQIIGKFQNPLEAVQKLTELNPDILFLDITMPNMSGFDLISVVNLPDTEIIFVTAHNDFALQAIRHCAIGY
ncbi:MAG: response regulator, partial [Flavobacteriaceae bacterium]|nr:response regulator [Flavobacteriaceae bacterium]